MADSKFTKGQERTFHKLKEALKELDDVVYVTPPKKKSLDGDKITIKVRK